jgi:hypothetical protein
MTKKSKKKSNKSTTSDRIWLCISFAAAFFAILWFGWMVFNAFLYGFAVECEPNQSKFENCYQFKNASVVKTANRVGSTKNPKIRVFLQTVDGDQIETDIRFIEFAESLTVGDSLKIEIWKQRVVNVQNNGKTYPTNENPRFSFSNMYFLDQVIIVLLLIVFFVGCVLLFFRLRKTINQ